MLSWLKSLFYKKTESRGKITFVTDMNINSYGELEYILEGYQNGERVWYEKYKSRGEMMEFIQNIIYKSYKENS